LPDDNVCPTCAVPEISGGVTNDGAPDEDEDTTTAVAADVPLAEPAEFDAVTLTRIVAPTSAEANRYDCPVAPPTDAQPLPAESHRDH
jgi:hypothetical protein